MRIGGEPTGLHFLAEVVELLLAESTLEKGPGVDSGGGMALDVEQVASVFFVRRMEEVVEADVVEGRSRSERRDVASSAESRGWPARPSPSRSSG